MQSYLITLLYLYVTLDFANSTEACRLRTAADMDVAMAKEAPVTLLDVLRVLDMASLERMFKTKSHSKFAGARLACRA